MRKRKRIASMLILTLFACIICTVTIYLIQQRNAQIFRLQVESAPIPEQCSFCENIDWGKYHAPCIFDLTTGTLTELEIYMRGDTYGEIAREQNLNHNIFRMDGRGGFMTVDRTKQLQRCIATVKKPSQYNATVANQFCQACRALLFSVPSKGFVVLDMYDIHAIKIYPVKGRAVYSIRDYTVTISSQRESYEIQATAHLF